MESRLTSPLPALIFDLDGTLIDSAPDIHAAANVALAAEGLGPIEFEQAKSFIGHGAGIFVSRLIKAKGLDESPEIHARLLALFMAEYEENPNLTKLYPGVLDALASFHARGYRMGICTNKPAVPAKIVLDFFGLTRFFSCIVGGDTLPQRKPHPAPLLHTLQQLGSQTAIYIGDSEVDAETAEVAARPFFLFTEGYRKTPVDKIRKTAEFSDFNESQGMLTSAVLSQG